jgi:hypothetical protein
VLTRRLLYLVCGLTALAGACSSALPIESPYEDDEPEPVLDASRPVDAGAPRDAGAKDAAVTRDAGLSVDAGPGHNCAKELPTAGFASLVTTDCDQRLITRCVSQAALDAELVRLARGCKVSQIANLGFSLSSSGCPTQFRYGEAHVLGAVSNCIQSQLERLRFDCKLECAVVRVP